MTKAFRLGIFIGRFQPFHHGHEQMVRTALAQAEQLLILLGSANTPRSLKNPFSLEEREEMIRATLPAEQSRLHFAPLDDYPYDDHSWMLHVQTQVQGIAQRLNVAQEEIALIGHQKDASSFYLSLFPQWRYIALPNFDGISATPIRQVFFAQDAEAALAADVPLKAPARELLQRFRQSAHFADLHEEYQQIQQEKALWAQVPYPVNLATVDAMIVHRGRILLVERGNPPGKGLLALPGGFLETHETGFEGCLRELREETGLGVNPQAWRHFLRHRGIYDAPGRSARGRIITQVFYFRIPDDIDLPSPLGADDAAQALWQDVQSLDARCFHDDHFHIIRDILNKTAD